MKKIVAIRSTAKQNISLKFVHRFIAVRFVHLNRLCNLNIPEIHRSDLYNTYNNLRFINLNFRTY